MIHSSLFLSRSSILFLKSFLEICLVLISGFLLGSSSSASDSSASLPPTSFLAILSCSNPSKYTVAWVKVIIRPLTKTYSFERSENVPWDGPACTSASSGYEPILSRSIQYSIPILVRKSKNTQYFNTLFVF